MSNTTESVSQKALDLIGKKIRYNKGKGKIITGVVLKVEKSLPLLNIKTYESIPSFQFLIKPEDGSRAIWSSCFPDR